MKSSTFHALCMVFCAALIGYGCDRADTTPAQTEAEAERPATDAAPAANEKTEIRVADIVGEPNRYLGQTVTVVADVEEVHSPYAFSLDEDSPLTGGVDNDLVVLSPKAANLSNIDDQWLNNKVRVTGEVGRMELVEIEREIGWDLDPQIEAELEKATAVIIAQSIQRIEQ